MRWLPAALVLVLATVWLRVAMESAAELEVARRLERDGDRHTAVRHYQYALRWYSPWAAAPREAADALERIGNEAAASGDRPLALEALRSLRGGMLATRSLWSPFGERLPGVNRKLARLTAEQQLAEQGGGNGTGGGVGVDTAAPADASPEALAAGHLRLLELDPRPRPAWSLAVVLGFACWITAIVLLLRRGLDRHGRLVGKPALVWGTLALAGLAVWLAGLWHA